MKLSDKIKIGDLLIKREVEFSKVYDCEQRINELLGEEYPYALPIELLSTQKKKTVRKKKPDKPKKVRKLNDEIENAYLITYLENDIEKQELIFETTQLNNIKSNCSLTFKITKIETCFVDEGQNRKIIEELPL